VPNGGGGPRSRALRAAADASRWAGGFLWLLLQSVCSARASTHNARTLLCPSPNRVSHLLSSTHRGAPATHRLLVTRAAYASPSLGLALRLWLHGSTRLILAVRVRVEGTAKGIAASVCRLRSCHPGRPAQHSLQPTALSLRFFILAYADRSWRLTAHYSTGGRLSFSVGLAAFSSTYSSSPPERSPLRAALRSQRARHQPRAPSALIGPPWLSCQPPCVLHSRRVCSAVARLGASPLPARLTTAHSCRARPCLSAAKGAVQVCADRRRPPRPPRPTPAAADRPLAAIFHLGVCRPLVAAHTAVLVGRPAELLRWAGGPRFRWFTFGCSTPAASCSPRKRVSPSPNHTRHLHSSAHRGTPASHRVFRTHVAYASPWLASALRPLAARLATVHSCRARPWHGRCKSRCDWCVPNDGTPTLRPAQQSMHPTALSLRFFTLSCAD
jgi:hypothetical protein